MCLFIATKNRISKQLRSVINFSLMKYIRMCTGFSNEYNEMSNLIFITNHTHTMRGDKFNLSFDEEKLNDIEIYHKFNHLMK